jgi:hypothetical protein
VEIPKLSIVLIDNIEAQGERFRLKYARVGVLKRKHEILLKVT